MTPIKITADSKGRFPNVWITSDTHFGHKNICRGVKIFVGALLIGDYLTELFLLTKLVIFHPLTK